MISKKIKKTRVSRKRSVNRGAFNIYLLFVLVAISVGVLFIGNLSVKDAKDDATAVNIKQPDSQQGKDNLQLYTFGYTTIEPTKPPPDKQGQPDNGGKQPDNGGKQPSGAGTCAIDELRKDGCECPAASKNTAYCDENLNDCNKNGGLKNDLPVPNPYPPGKQFCMYNPDTPKSKEKLADTTNCVSACIGKPVIYLYPTVPTLVDVSIVSPGRIYISDPLYPTGGWKQVLAHPDGRLRYQDKEYQELYYETEVASVAAPKAGIVIPTAHLETRLEGILDQLGLRGNEKEEFMDYWMPRLVKLHAPYILFSILEPEEKERVDHVDIYPKPDTFIGFIAYFKAINTPFYPIDPLIIPESPKRTGFTAVEWGGTISNN